MKQEQTQKNTKKRNILLGCLIPFGAAVIATAITLPLVLNKKSGGNTPQEQKITKAEWINACNEVNYLNKEDTNFTINLKSTFDDGEGKSFESSSSCEVVGQKYHRVDEDGTQYGTIQKGVHIKLTKSESSEKYSYALESEEPLLPFIDITSTLSDDYDNTKYDSSANTYSGSIVSKQYGNCTYVITFKDKKIDTLLIKGDMGDATLTLNFVLSNYDKTKLASWPEESQIVNNIVTSTHDAGTWESEKFAVEANTFYIVSFDLSNKTLSETNTMSFASTSGNIKKSNISCSKAFLIQKDNLIADQVDSENVTWAADELSFTFNSTLNNSILYVQFESTQADTDVTVTFTSK